MSDAAYRPVRYPRWKAGAARLLEMALWPLATTARRPGGLAAVRRILIVEPFRLGDAALLRGMFEPLRARFPGAEIHLLLHPCAAKLYAGCPYVSRVHAIAFPWVNSPGSRAGWMLTLRFLASLRSIEFDLGIDPRGDVRSQAVLAAAGCAERAGHTNYLASNIRIAGRLLTRNAGDIPLGHRADIHGAILELLGCLRAAVPATPRRRTDNERKRVVISTGAGWSYRLWPEDRWAEVLRWLAARSDVDIRLVGSPAERTRLDRIREIAGVEVTTEITDLPALLRELSVADLVVCPDSAVMHLASEWFGVPVLALFGPGVVPLYRPRSPGSRVLDRQSQYTCAPCTQQRCVCPANPCMGAISVEAITEDLADMLER